MAFIDKLLAYFNLSYEEYNYLTRDLDFNMYQIPREFPGMKEASDFIKEAIANHEKIMVYGDYDTDGIMSTSILVKALMQLGVEPGYYIPSRYLDGYGMTLEKAKEIADKEYNLVILVDNGVSVYDPILYLRDKGISVVVIDHHTLGDKLPIANYLIHPDIAKYGDTPVSAGYLAYLFSYYLLGYFDYRLALLGTISTVSDMMPLKEYNRDLLRSVFKSYRIGLYPAIDTLNEGLKLDENAISSRISPKINAIGRIVKDSSINRLVRYFVTDDAELITKYALWINEVNNERKSISEQILQSVETMESEPSYVLRYDISEGMLGIIANSILHKFNVPVVCLGPDSILEGCLRGSIRTPEGYDVMEIFSGLSKYLLASGGHTNAGGLTIKESDFKDFTHDFKELVSHMEKVEISQKVIDVNITELLLENYYIVHKLSPYGVGWEQPLFKLSHLKTDTLQYSKNGEHIITKLSLNAKLVGFGYSREPICQYKFIDVTGIMEENEYRGHFNLDFVIKELKESL